VQREIIIDRSASLLLVFFWPGLEEGTMIKRYRSILLGLVFLSLAVALWAMPARQEEAAQASSRIRVRLDPVEATRVRRSVRFAAVTRARDQAMLPFAVPARVVARPVEAGDAVAAGQVLARLDSREYRNAVDAARAAVSELETRHAQSRRDLRRAEELAAAHVATAATLEQAGAKAAALAASLEAARARLKETRRLLDETVLKAPFSGTVTGVHVEPGEWAAPGQPAIELAGDGPVELKVEVPESIVAHLRVGQAVRVLLPFSDRTSVPGRISAVAQAAIREGRLFPVKVDLAPGPAVRAGLTAQVQFDLATDPVLTVPLAAVVNPGASRPSVFVHRDGSVQRREVRLGRLAASRVIVRGDLQAGDRVVVAGQSQLADGDAVTVVR
jgi:RND family efflux transporter MFP subunit